MAPGYGLIQRQVAPGHALRVVQAAFPLLPMADLFRSRGTLATRAADLQQPVPDHSGARIPFHQPATAMCPDPLANRAHVDGEDGEPASPRSEEHTSELQSLMRISYAVFCLKKKITH